MFGFLLVDKPEGIASFGCVRQLRKILNVRRMGFVGTLDPLATGLMIFAVGEATKMIPYLEGMDKTYDVVVRLGATSNTYDAEGEIEERRNPPEPRRDEIEELLEEEFLGEREQVPPQFSAIQIEGKRAYELARRKQEVRLKPRRVTFYDLVLKSYKWPRACFTVHCSSGTYVRSFAHDLGEKLGCGGYVEALRRTKIGSYSVKDAVQLNDIHEVNARDFLLAPQHIFFDWRQIRLTKEEYETVAHGGLIPAKTSLKGEGPFLALYGGLCVGVLEKKGDVLKFKRRFHVIKP